MAAISAWLVRRKGLDLAITGRMRLDGIDKKPISPNQRSDGDCLGCRCLWVPRVPRITHGARGSACTEM